MAGYTLSGIRPEKDPQWVRIRAALMRANPQLRDGSFTPVPPHVKKPKFQDAPLIGAAYGRLWEITYQRPGTFSPDQLLHLVTGIRWDDPERMILYETPWLYIGGRPRIFSRLSPDLERIVEKQKRAERSLAGFKTGDPGFDRRWAFYVYRSSPAEVLRDPGRRQWLESLAALRPSRRDEFPTIGSLGTTAGLGLVIGDSDETVRQMTTLVQSFSGLLDAIELSTGNLAASQVPLTMDLLPDGTGYLSPTLRFRCASCGEETHPRFVPEFHTEMCDRCRKGLYNSW